jgi:hypothetical protein
MNLFDHESASIIVLFTAIVGVLAILIIQFFRIRMFRKWFRELSAVFSRDKKLDYPSLVEKIIQSKEIYRAGPAIEVTDLIQNYIKRITGDSRVFIHVAPDKATAESIVKEGFKYSDDFHRSSEEISSDLSDLAYKLQICRPFGKFVMILCIPKDLLHASNGSVVTGKQDFLAEHGISEYNPDHEPSYTLPTRFVCGYIDIDTHTIVENKRFSIS